MNIIEFIINLFCKSKPVEITIEATVAKELDKPEKVKTLDLTLLDKKDIEKVKLLYPRIQEIVYKFLLDVKKAGLKGGIFSGYRSFEEQNVLYAKGRTKPGNIVTNAPAGASFHNYGLAVDFVFKNKKGWTWQGPYNKIAEIARNNGLESGYYWTSFPDAPHVQKTFKQKKSTLLNAHNKGGLQAVWFYLDKIA